MSSLGLLAIISIHLCYGSDVVLRVSDLQGKALAGIPIGLVDGNLVPTGSAGRLVLKNNHKQGEWISLMIGDDEWTWVSPWDGRILVPEARESAHMIVLAKKGQRELLTQKDSLKAIISMILFELRPRADGLKVELSTALKKVGTLVGLSPDEIKDAIHRISTDDNYDKGLKLMIENDPKGAELEFQIALEKAAEKQQEVLVSLALSQYRQGKYSLAADNYSKAVQYRPEDLDVRFYMYAAMIEAGNYDSLEPMLREGLETCEKEPANEFLLTAYSGWYGHLLLAINSFAEAEPLLLKAVDLEAKSGNKVNVPFHCDNLGCLYFYLEQYSDAEFFFKLALHLDETINGPCHESVGKDLSNLGVLFTQLSRLSEAEGYLSRALEIDEDIFGDNHPSVALRLSNLAFIYLKTNNVIKAERYFRRALTINEQFYGSDHPIVANDLNNLGGALKTNKNFKDAEIYFRRSIEIFENNHDVYGSKLSQAINNLANILMDQKRYEESESMFIHAIDIGKKTLGEINSTTAGHITNLAMLYKSMRLFKKSEALFREALGINLLVFGDSHPNVSRSLNNLAYLLNSECRFEEAEIFYNSALAIDEGDPGFNYAEVGRDLNNLATLQEQKGSHPEAIATWQLAFNILNTFLGDAHPTTIVVKDWLDSFGY